MASGLAWVGLTLGAGALGAIASVPGRWYQALDKPAWNPPAWVFGPVWTTLYVLMGIAAALAWHSRHRRPGSPAFLLFGLQLGLNALWSWLFFRWHRPDLALADLVVLWGTILGTAIAFHRIRPLAGWLLVPYLGWVAFAGVLNASISGRNPGGVPGSAVPQSLGIAATDCAPWDGSATSIYLTPGSDLSGLPPTGSYLQIVIYQSGPNLPGTKVDISHHEGNIGSGIAVRCASEGQCASTNVGTIQFEKATGVGDLVGWYELDFNGEVVAGAFRAIWSPRRALCG